MVPPLPLFDPCRARSANSFLASSASSATIAVSIQCSGSSGELMVPSPDLSTRTASSRCSAIVSGDESEARGVSHSSGASDSNDLPFGALHAGGSVVSRASASYSHFDAPTPSLTLPPSPRPHRPQEASPGHPSVESPPEGSGTHGQRHGRIL